MEAQVVQFLASRCPAFNAWERVVVTPLRGGLEAVIARATVHGLPRGHCDIPRRFIIKELRGTQRREAAVYDELWVKGAAPPAARVLGTTRSEDVDFLFLEDVRSLANWPWSDTDASMAVCRVLAKLHRAKLPRAAILSDWNYEEELRASAASTLAFAAAARGAAGGRIWQRFGDLKNVVAALPALRGGLLGEDLAFIHGDMHPGNVLVRRRGQTAQVVLIDWARARLGSPLEDLASWLHSLGCWEPDARRRHDTLLHAYLEERGEPRELNPQFRSRYWYASACNGLSGAIRYHLSVLSNLACSADLRCHSLRALAEWERVIRRVAAILATNRRD
jgi:hypothetical protein